MPRPLVSVIIPNLNSPIIGQTLAALRGQHFDLDQVEVLVVGMDAPGQVEQDARVRLVDTGRPTSAAFNRNLGMNYAQGEIFCFTDADCEPAPDWVTRLMAALEQPGVDVVGGGVVFAQGNYWATCDHVSWFNQVLTTAPRGQRPHLPTLNLAVRRSVVEAVGVIDETYPLAAGEDTEWTARMAGRGYALYFEPEAVVTHAAQRTTFAALWRHGYNYGRYSPKVSLRAHCDTKIVGQLPKPLRGRRRILAASPLLATLAAARALARAGGRQYWRLGPGVWLSKIAWCFGAAQALAQSR